jgi:hypothetical protein
MRSIIFFFKFSVRELVTYNFPITWPLPFLKYRKIFKKKKDHKKSPTTASLNIENTTVLSNMRIDRELVLCKKKNI